MLSVRIVPLSVMASPDDVFSSVAKMESLVHQENALVDMLDTFLVDAKLRINVIQK